MTAEGGNNHTVPENIEVVKRGVPEEVTLIRDLKKAKERAKQRPRGRADLVDSRNSRAILEQESEKRRDGNGRDSARLCRLRQGCGLNSDGTALEILDKAVT